jgi:hypothetical protein
MTVTEEGVIGTREAAYALREWDPLPTDEDRVFPHFIDHF